MQRSSVIQGSFPAGLASLAQKTRVTNTPHGAAVQLKADTAASRGIGQPLPPAVRQKMEALFNTRFDDVRVHVGGEAASLGAIAWTRGSDIHFAPGRYNPLSPQGQKLLAHELTHVVQQRAGRVRNPFPGGVAVVHDASLEAEAERFAHRALQPAPRVPGTIQRATSSSSSSSSVIVRRAYASFRNELGAGEVDIFYDGAGKLTVTGTFKDFTVEGFVTFKKKMIEDHAVVRDSDKGFELHGPRHLRSWALVAFYSHRALDMSVLDTKLVSGSQKTDADKTGIGNLLMLCMGEIAAHGNYEYVTASAITDKGRQLYTAVGMTDCYDAPSFDDLAREKSTIETELRSASAVDSTKLARHGQISRLLGANRMFIASQTLVTNATQRASGKWRKV